MLYFSRRRLDESAVGRNHTKLLKQERENGERGAFFYKIDTKNSIQLIILNSQYFFSGLRFFEGENVSIVALKNT